MHELYIPSSSYSTAASVRGVTLAACRGLHGAALLLLGAAVDHPLPDLAVHQHRLGRDLQPHHAGLLVLQPHGAGGGFLRHHRVAGILEADLEDAGAVLDALDADLL